MIPQTEVDMIARRMTRQIRTRVRAGAAVLVLGVIACGGGDGRTQGEGDAAATGAATGATSAAELKALM